DNFDVRITDQHGLGNSGTISVTVNGVNDAPVLNSGTFTLPDIAEDNKTSAGDTVANIVGAAITDVDTGAVEGIAVTAVTDTNGKWQFSTDAGANWSDIGAVTDSAARLLDSAAKIRFVPNDDYNGTAGTITFRAWDTTSGTNGGTADVSTNGAGTAFSSGSTQTATLNVTAVNDAPVAQADTASAVRGALEAVIVNDDHATALGTNATQVLTNDGSGGLSAANATVVPNARNNDVKLADLDGDGDLDALTSSFQVLINQGGTQSGTAGTFVTSNIAGVSGSAQGLAAGDIDGDGDTDFLAANWPTTANQILTNDGSGGFTATTLAGGNNHSRDVALADVDGDGDLDAIVANDTASNQLLLNQGGIQAGTIGTFADSVLPSIHVSQAGVISMDVVFADFDGDGDQDAVIANSGGANELLRNNGSGVFTAETLAGGTFESTAMAAGDLNGDNHIDLVVVNNDGQANQVLINDGSGFFTATAIGGSNGHSRDVALGDINGDGHLDAIVTNNDFDTSAEDNQLLINNGNGTFTVSNLPGGGNASNGVALGNLGPLLTGSVATNDSDVDSTGLTYALTTPVDGLTFKADGSWSFDTGHPSYVHIAQGSSVNVVANYTVSDGIAAPV
ncbi:MAG: VCBS repeat-containing protein, partial [Rhizobiaceae bacterium]|nr:VCBS repeat-containing protein [Rhizobiaceae bacterium]